MDLLTQHFWSCDIDRILKMSLGSSMSPDQWFWFHLKHGQFTVRSCYHSIMESALASDTSTSGEANPMSPEEWKWIWGLQLPPKI